MNRIRERHNEGVTPLTHLDYTAIARECERYGVARLQIFGSILSERFDPERSDVDFLVEYKAEAERTFQSFFGLRSALESIVGRPVDLIDVRTLRNPYFSRNVLSSAQDVYTA